jgi:hypothetical protein
MKRRLVRPKKKAEAKKPVHPAGNSVVAYSSHKESSYMWPHSTRSRIMAGVFVLAIAGVGSYFILNSSADQVTFTQVGNPYINSNQLLPGSETSYYDQPWRGYMETVPATTLLNGIGTVYAPGTISPAQEDKDMQYMASVGVKAVRKEFDWSSIDPTNETQFSAVPAAKYAEVLADSKKYGITPTILLNANDGAPEPTFIPVYKASLVHAITAGATQMTVTGVPASAIVIHTPNTATGGSGTSDGDDAGVRAHHMFTNMVANKDGSLTLTFSRPTTQAMAAGSDVHIQYLKYMPLYPVGTPEFNNTMVGWNNFVKAAANLVKASGLPKVNFEIWNEEAFGSRDLDANNYYAPTAPVNTTGINKMHPGGQAWEMANQTTQYLKSVFGGNVSVDWGFSNTNAYETSVTQLPPNIDAESFHPYGGGLVNISKVNKLSLSNLIPGPYVPNVQRQLPEGGLSLGDNVQNLITGKLQPSKREYKEPPGTSHFQYWFTETGFSPGNNKQVHTPAENDLLKSKAELRSLSFWINKGLSQFDYGSAFRSDGKDNNEANANLLAYGAQDDGGNPASPQAEALRNFTGQFAGATSLTASRNLGVTVTDTTPDDNTAAYNVFPADPATHEPALHYREMFQFLPFQVTNNKFVIPTYVESLNIVSPPPPMDFQVDITNVNGNNATVSYYDPITNKAVPITVVSRSDHDLVVSIESIDYPRLIEITEPPGSTTTQGPTSSAPTVSFNTPADGAVLAGKTLTLGATASADTTNVQFELDGVKLGSPITSKPFNYIWDTTTVPNGTKSHVLSAIATNAAGLTSTAKLTVTVVNPDTTAPSVPVTLNANSRQATAIELAWNNSTDNPGGTGVAGYHLYRDGKLIASPIVTKTPNDFYSDTGLLPATSYIYTISAYDAAGNTSVISPPVTLTTKPH